ncbi:MAG: DUF4405 domain-containing protein [Ignavibacteria bacterium]|jgi:hypothetical protein
MERTEKKRSISNITEIDLALAISGFYFILSGLLIQFKYHMHDRFHQTLLLGMDYTKWNAIHIIASLLGLLLICIHVYHHRKWYFRIFKNKKLPKQKPTLIISIIFVIMAITGLLALTAKYLNLNDMRFMFIEIHDKFGILLSVLLTGHFLRRSKVLWKNIFKKNKLQKNSNLNTNLLNL